MGRLEELAIAIADHAARADIEIFAKNATPGGDDPTYLIDKPSCDVWDENWQMILAHAVEYIELRGDALPFVMHRTGRGVWFEERVIQDSN